MSITTAQDIAASDSVDREAQRLDPSVLMARAQQSLSASPRPFLRWAGSKQRLLTQIVPYLPRTLDRYYEPFLGAGALFFLLRPQRASLSDTCQPLIDTYRGVKEDAPRVADRLRLLDPLDRDMYYRVRAEAGGDLAERTARFIYLNRACWNGLYRVNSKGHFNVPYGAPKSGNLITAEDLLACAEALSRDVSVSIADFEEATLGAGRGDLVFFDPPYVTGHNNNGFLEYNEKLFSWADQERLASHAGRLAQRGVTVLISNAFHAEVLHLYRAFDLHLISRASTLAGNPLSRKSVQEALFVSGGS